MSREASHPVVVAVTGASGAIYAARLLQVLLALGKETHLAISESGATVMEHELRIKYSACEFKGKEFLGQVNSAIERIGFGAAPQIDDADFQSCVSRLHHHGRADYMAPIASGSFLTSGMVICPCSGGTLAAVACGLSSNLIHRAASVHLKERRTLILVPRETPLSLAHLDNLRRAHEMGAVVLPAMPGWYQEVRCVGDLVDFVVARILDQLGIEHQLSSRWGE